MYKFLVFGTKSSGFCARPRHVRGKGFGTFTTQTEGAKVRTARNKVAGTQALQDKPLIP